MLADLKLKSNDYFNQASMTADVRALQDKYGSVGYVFADIKPDPRFLEEPGQLDLVYNIAEGDRYRVGKINIQIKGEYSHTQENTVRNRLFFKPGDIVDIRQIRASEVALKRSGLFESNPAQGNAPKIVFSPPDRDGQQSGGRRRAASRRKAEGRTAAGRRFRGQSPDSDSRDRELDLTVDCGRYVGPPEESPRPRALSPLVMRASTSAPAAAVARGVSPDASSRLLAAAAQFAPAALRPHPQIRFVRSRADRRKNMPKRWRGQRANSVSPAIPGPR